jgi:hypothetical protein
MDWLMRNTSGKLAEFRVLEDLPDVSETATPPHGGEIVVNCMKCRAMSRLAKKSQSSTEKAIVEALKKTTKLLSGREIADRASLKYNSFFRSSLSHLVSLSIVIKIAGKSGYVLTDKLLS